jgi:hypothetical protein
MRPKTVILVLVAGVAALAALILFKGLVGSGGGETAEPQTNAPVVTAGTSGGVTVPEVRVRPDTNILAMTREEEIQKELDDIRENLGNGNGVPIMDKLNHSDSEVRSEAINALKAMDYRDAIPRLKTALDTTQDVKEKVAILETIEYLQQPAMGEDLSPTNPALGTNKPLVMRTPPGQKPTNMPPMPLRKPGVTPTKKVKTWPQGGAKGS